MREVFAQRGDKKKKKIPRLVATAVFEEVRWLSHVSLAATLIKAQTDGTATMGNRANTARAGTDAAL